MPTNNTIDRIFDIAVSYTHLTTSKASDDKKSERYSSGRCVDSVHSSTGRRIIDFPPQTHRPDVAHPFKRDQA